MVRPNAEIIPSEHTLSVKIVTQSAISTVSTRRHQTHFLTSVGIHASPVRQILSLANQVGEPSSQNPLSRGNRSNVVQNRER